MVNKKWYSIPIEKNEIYSKLSLRKIVTSDIEMKPILKNNLFPKPYPRKVPFSKEITDQKRTEKMVESINNISDKIYNQITIEIAQQEYLKYVFVASKTEIDKFFNNNYI